MKKILVLFMLLNPMGYSSAIAENNLHVATYNSKFLSACMNKERVINYQKVADKLVDVDVIALQEVRDRFAVERYFTTDKWSVIMDDDSTDDMNLAYAVRNGVKYRLESGNLKNADDITDFVFDKKTTNFIGERRVLKLIISHGEKEILILNHHAKSRYNGRKVTEPTRVASSVDLVNYLSSTNYANYILLGDFNDTPDDSSLNTLENGIISPQKVENTDGDFLVNVTEKLLLNEEVSYGLKSQSKTNSIIKRVDPSVTGSRSNNIDSYELDSIVTHAMYDQILVSNDLIKDFSSKYHAYIFDDLVAVTGNADTRASDHIPVILELGEEARQLPNLKISELLPNPTGIDRGNETITITNTGGEFKGEVILQDLSLKNTILQLDLPAGISKTITITTGVTLNNSSDTIRLLDRYENLLDEVAYLSSKENQTLKF